VVSLVQDRVNGRVFIADALPAVVLTIVSSF
jgi:hypothetical protein